MPRIIGYLRAGVNGQDVKSQLGQLKAAGASKIFQEQTSGTKYDRPLLEKLVSDVRDGDTVVVTSLDRIAHNTKHLLEIVESLDANGVTLKVIDKGIDTSTPPWRGISRLLGAITDFEQQVVRERQAEGIDRAKREGRYKGRKPTAKAKTEEVLALNARGLTKQRIAEQVGIGVASVYRILKNHAVSRDKYKKPLSKALVKKKQVKRKPTREHHGEQLSFF